jgi:biotin operon repressor
MSDRVTDERRLPFYTVEDLFLKRFGKIVGPNGIAVYNALCMHANKRTGESWPSRETIHEVTGLSVRAISSSLKTLKQHGLIDIKSTTGGPNHYFILPIPDVPLAPRATPTPAPRARGTAQHASPPAPDATPLAPHAPEQESRTRIKNKRLRLTPPRLLPMNLLTRLDTHPSQSRRHLPSQRLTHLKSQRRNKS